MKIILFKIALFLFIISSFSCNQSKEEDINNRILALESQVVILKANVEMLKANIEYHHQVALNDTSEVPTYKWFRLGETNYQIVNNNFIVTQIKSEYKNNGYEITGIVQNISNMNAVQVPIIGAIENNSKYKKVITGSEEISRLTPGISTGFNIFIPTSQSNVERVGIKIGGSRIITDQF